MKRTTTITIMGIGGVGGYVGGMLARRYRNDPSVKINFAARGENGTAIRNNGLILKTIRDTFQVFPDKLCLPTEECGPADYIIYCLKSYSVADSLPGLRLLLHSDSVIIPFMNGIEGPELLKKSFPEHKVWDACVYIVAHRETAGKVVESGGYPQCYFGSRYSDREQSGKFEELCRAAGINLSFKTNIMEWVWEKFSYISPVATLSTAYNLTNGDILSDPLLRDRLFILFREFEEVARARKIALPDNLINRNLNRMLKSPLNMITSMQRDYYAGKPCEYESLTGYVVRAAKAAGISVPEYESLYERIKSGAPLNPVSAGE